MKSPASRDLLSALCAIHAGAMLVFLTWVFAGLWVPARPLNLWLCAPAPILTVWSLLSLRKGRHLKAALVLLPLALFAIQIAVSLSNPNMEERNFWGTQVLSPIAHNANLPTTASPRVTLNDLLANAGLVLIGLNLYLAPARRNWQHRLLWLIAINGTLMACLGTLLKLASVPKILGMLTSPNPSFFGAFSYHNHWGAFALLNAGLLAGLARYQSLKNKDRPFTQTPGFFLLLCFALVLITLPLSAARASSAAGFCLLLMLGCSFLLRLRGQHTDSRSRRQLTIGAASVIALVVITAVWLGENSIKGEIHATQQQIDNHRQGVLAEPRFVVYQDTWRMIQDHPVFGWGWGSFQYVFPQYSNATLSKQGFFTDAHSDWLQLPAEMGIIGTFLLLAFFMALLISIPWRAWRAPPLLEILTGMVALLLLAVFDFPFGNPAVVCLWWILCGLAPAVARERLENSK